MMTFVEFKGKLEAALKDGFEQRFMDVDISYEKIEKTLESYEGLVIRMSNKEMSISIDLDQLYCDFCTDDQRRNFGDMVHEVIDSCFDAFAAAPRRDFLEKLRDYSWVKERLIVEVVPTRGRESLMKTAVSKKIDEDMVAFYKIVEGDYRVLLNIPMLDCYKITAEELHRDAVASMQRKYPATLISLCKMGNPMFELLNTVFAEYGLPCIEDDFELLPLAFSEDGGRQDYDSICTGTYFYDDFWKKTYEKYGVFYLLPISVRDFYVLAGNGLTTAHAEAVIDNYLSVMESLICPDEVFGKHAYVYDVPSATLKRA